MRRIALLVGNGSFDPASDISNLRFPVSDVEALAKILRDPEIGRYDRVVTVIDRASGEILSELNTLLEEERGAAVLFYYSGHGKPTDSGRLYLAARNTTQRLLPATGVSFGAILEMKDSCGFGRFAVILDCCFAGLGSPDIRGTRDDQLKAFADGRGVFFLGAATATQIAKEDSKLGHGVLTAAILDGLSNGLADVDGDGKVSGPDLFAWCVRFAERHGAQRPVQVNRVAEGELVLAYSRQRLASADIERVRSKLLMCFENNLLGFDDLDRLRKFFFDQVSVPRPDPKSLEGGFFAYVQGETTWDQFAAHRLQKSPAISNNIEVSEPNRVQGAGPRNVWVQWASVLKPRSTWIFLVLAAAIAALTVGYLKFDSLSSLITAAVAPTPPLTVEEACRKFPSLCDGSNTNARDAITKSVPKSPGRSSPIECFSGLGDCPAEEPANPACVKGLGDCPQKK